MSDSLRMISDRFPGTNRHWHFYTRQEIKPQAQGGIVMAVGFTEQTCETKVCLFDMRVVKARTGTDLGSWANSVFQCPNGVVFQGVSKEAAKRLRNCLQFSRVSFEFHLNNKSLMSAAIHSLVSRPLSAAMDPGTFCLTRGATHLLPAFDDVAPRSLARIRRNKIQNAGILVVEDMFYYRGAYAAQLLSDGHRVFVAKNGAEALKLLREQGTQISILLLKWKIRGMSGIEVLRKLTDTHPHPLLVLMMTHFCEADMQRQFYALRSENVLPLDYIIKGGWDQRLMEMSLAMRMALLYKRPRLTAGR